jgi:hypothetical protein
MAERSTKSKKNIKSEEKAKGNLAGLARRRGIPVMYDEVKESWNIKITPTAKQIIKEAAQALNFSASEFIERWARAELTKPESPTHKET